MTETQNLPAFISTRQKENEEGETETLYGLELHKMTDGDTISLKVASDPKVWPEYSSKYDQEYMSKLAFFETELNGETTKVTAFLSMNPDRQRSRGQGNNLWSAVSDLSEGDEFVLVRRDHEVKTGQYKGTKSHIYEVSTDFQDTE